MVGAVALGSTVGAWEAAAAKPPAVGLSALIPSPAAAAAVLPPTVRRGNSFQDLAAAFTIGMSMSPNKCMLV